MWQPPDFRHLSLTTALCAVSAVTTPAASTQYGDA